MKNDILGELLEKNKQLEDQFNKMNDSALQLMEINKEHQRINGELREENKRLQEEATYMTKKAYDFFSALLDIKEILKKQSRSLDWEPWSTYQVSGEKLFDITVILDKVLGSDKE